MAVMMVIAILLSVAAVGIQSIDRGQATTTALAITEALFDETRSKAVGGAKRARLLIHKELNDAVEEDRERYLRSMYVAVESTNQAGEAQGGGWEIITRKTDFPKGVYFSIEESERVAAAIGVGKPGTMSIRLSRKSDSPLKECYYFEFNPEGVCVDSENAALDPGAVVVLISGVRPRGEEEPTLLKNNKVGFVVWRNGRTSIFRSPEQIDRAQ
jgi:type II secretory pathway pseudopilin PulG